MNQHLKGNAPHVGRSPFLALPSMTALLVLVITGAGCGRCASRPDIQTLVFASDDGFHLTGTMLAPEIEHPPGLILVHRYAGDRDGWAGFAQAARALGMLVLAVDLRGHGDSRIRNGEPVHYRQIPDWHEALLDIRAAKDVLFDHGAHPDNLAIAGEGFGANLALHYALKDPDIQAVVMLSPGLDYQGLRTEGLIQELTDCPTLLMTAEGDAYAAMSADALHTAAPVFSELRSWSGAAHGTGLFAAHPESVNFVLRWLLHIIGPER